MFSLALFLLAMQSVSGKDFLLVMAYKMSSTYVKAVTGETGGLLQLQYPHFGYRTSQATGSFGYAILYIDEKMKIKSSIETKAIIISASDADMQITVHGDSCFSSLPISSLGTKYIVPSDSKLTGHYQQLLVVATHSQSTDVEISFRIKQGYINFNGQSYRDGDNVSLVLGSYQTLTIITRYDINGTVINAKESIAVYTGIIYNNTYTAYDQLLPVKLHGQEFVVAVVERNTGYFQLQVIADQSDTQINFNSGATVSLGENRFYQRPLRLYGSIHVSATRPVMVTLIKRDGVNSVFATIPPVKSYVNHTVSYATPRGSPYVVKILTRKTATVMIQRKKQFSITVDWEAISGSEYKVGTVIRATGVLYPLIAISSDHSFTVLTYNTGSSPYYRFSVSLEKTATKPFGGRTYLMTLPGFLYNPVILASAGEKGGQWEVQNPYTGKIWSRQFKPFDTDYFYPQYSVNTTNGIQNKTILVNVESVQVRGVSGNARFFPLPISALGTKYVMSSCHPSGFYISLMVIATHSKKTNVDIAFRLDGNVTYDNKTYSNGNTLSLTLMEYQVFTINSSSDLTGTVITAEETIAVYSATYKSASLIALIAYEQLLPDSHHGNEYVVAVRDDSPEQYHSSLPYQLQVVTDHIDTHIRFNDGSTVTVGDTRVYRKRFGPRTFLYFNTTQPVMTTLCTVAVPNGHYRHGRFTVISPVTYYIKQSTQTNGGTLQILTDKGNNNVHVERPHTSTVYNIHVDWTPIPMTKYKVGTCTAGSSTFIRSNSSFGVLVYSNDFIHNGGFSFKFPNHPRTKPTTRCQTPLIDDNAVMGVGVCGGVVIVSLLVCFTGYILYLRRKMKSFEDNHKQRHPTPSTPTDNSLNAPISQDSNTYMELDRRNSPENFYDNALDISASADSRQKY